MDEYNVPTSPSRREEELRDELRRIRTTASFQFGFHFVDAVKRPWRLILLPLTTPWLVFKLVRTKKVPKKTEQRVVRDCIVVFSAESTRGLHFDRAEALLGSFSDQTSQLIHVSTDDRGYRPSDSNVIRFGIPSRRHSKNMSPTVWNRQFEIHMNGILDVYSPKTFVFDGDYPFRGMLNSIEFRPEMNRFWIRESPNNHKISKLPLQGFEDFDAILHPSLSKTSDPDGNVGRSGSIFCDPIVPRIPNNRGIPSLLTTSVDPSKQVVFFDLTPSIPYCEKIARHLLKRDDVVVLVRENMTIKSVLASPKVRIGHGMEYAQLIQMADVAVLYPDQFSVHTSFLMKTPALSVLSENITKHSISEETIDIDLPMIYLDDSLDDLLISKAIERLLDKDVQSQVINRIEAMDPAYDGTKLVEYLMDLHH